MTVQLQRRLFTADEYFRMIEAGILTKYDHVELIEGEIVEMPPKGDFHVGLLSQLNVLFKPVLGTDALMRFHDPLRLTPDSAPEPDVLVVKPRSDFYKDSGPTVEDVLLLIEVADSTLRYDQRVKVPLYAQAGIREVWIVNIPERSIEVHKEPSSAGYLVNSILRGQDRVSPSALPSVSFTVNQLFG